MLAKLCTMSRGALAHYGERILYSRTISAMVHEWATAPACVPCASEPASFSFSYCGAARSSRNLRNSRVCFATFDNNYAQVIRLCASRVIRGFQIRKKCAFREWKTK